MSEILPLRDYQRGALDAIREMQQAGEHNRIACVLPTGAGKTVCFAHMVREFLAAHRDMRVIVLVHTDELVTQAFNKIKQIAPNLSVGIVKGSRRETRASAIVASVQSLRNPMRRREIQRVGLVIVDECHHATAKTYLDILAHYGCFSEQRTQAVGFTATLVRGDGKSLGNVWEAIAFSRDIPYMIRQRYLVPVRGKVVQVPDLDLSKIKSTRTDFREGELGSALADSLAPELIAEAYANHAKDRSGIAFFPTVASAYVFAEAFNERDIKCEVVHGGLELSERRAILNRLELGITQVVANCMVLTEGFDSPRVSCVVVGRPTKSAGLYIQMVGRGLRVDPSRKYDGQDCLILDVVGVASRHSLCSIADLSPIPVKEVRKSNGDVELELDLTVPDEYEADEAEYYSGVVEVKAFDPLNGSSVNSWQRTKGGTYFTPAGKDAFVFLAPTTGPEGEANRFTVAWCTRERALAYVLCGNIPRAVHRKGCACERPAPMKRGGRTEHVGLDLGTAFGWAEDLAADMGAEGLNVTRNAPWRKKPASDKMLNTAEAYGCNVQKGMRAGQVSDLITSAVATRRIDAIIKRMDGK